MATLRSRADQAEVLRNAAADLVVMVVSTVLARVVGQQLRKDVVEARVAVAGVGLVGLVGFDVVAKLVLEPAPDWCLVSVEMATVQASKVQVLAFVVMGLMGTAQDPYLDNDSICHHHLQAFVSAVIGSIY